ncbi:hypothetical protein ACQCU1_03910 [Sutcliffiella horikoshii]|uniref:hypothetical protein n=1 Tax=Sutcliffiella horikoshii TaxID=79883 RepID=UPI003CF93184
MKTAGTRKKEQRSLHRGNEGISDEKKGAEKSIIEVMKTAGTRKKEQRSLHRGNEGISDEKKGAEKSS